MIKWIGVPAVAVLALATAHASTLTGEVTSNGNPLRGVLITLFSADQLYSETVLTGATGHYKLVTDQHGSLSLRARAAQHADTTTEVVVPAGDATLSRSFTLHRFTTPKEISDNLPATAHAARVKFPTADLKHLFMFDCTGCHQLGAPATLKTHSAEEWIALMKVMLIGDEYPTEVHVNDYAAAMQKAFDGTPTPDHENSEVDEGSLTERVTEWRIPEGLGIHDTNYYPPTGQFYSVDMFKDDLFVTDPKTNKTTLLPLPPLDVPLMGTFAGQKDAPYYIKSIRHGLHSLELGPDGNWYMTGSVGGNILVYDPRSNKFQSHGIGGKASLPHTLRFDSKGILWFTVYLSDQVGRFDPKTGHMTLIQLPKTINREVQKLTGRGSQTYGLDINPWDGSVWYTRLVGNAVGRIDPTTFKVQEWDPPVFGPRRARFDKDGGLWIPGYGDGKIARLDTKTMKYQIFTVPTLAPDEQETPYAVGVDPRTQDVWVSANMSDRMFRFTPSTNKWVAYPLPTKGTITRDVMFTPDGRVCGLSNPWGIPAPGLVEGNMDALVCVQPNVERRAGDPSASNTIREPVAGY